MLVLPRYFKPDCITCQWMTHSLPKPEPVNTFSMSDCVFVSMLPLPALGFVSPISLCYLLQPILCLLQHHPPFQGISILHCCTNCGVETKVRWSGSSMRRKNSNQLSFSKKYIFRCTMQKVFRKRLVPEASDLTASCKHHTMTTWKRAVFSHCFFLLACSLFTQCHSTMKTADQRNQVLTGLKIKINATLVPYPSS